MNALPATLKQQLAAAFTQLDTEIAEKQKQKDAIQVLLGEPAPAQPPFPYREKPLAVEPPKRKVKLTQEFRVFCKGRPNGDVFSVKNFITYLENNFDESQYVPRHAGPVFQQACKTGFLQLVKRGSSGPGNVSLYKVA